MSRSAGQAETAASSSKQKGGKGAQVILAELRGRDPDEILTTPRIIEITGVSQQTVLNWISRKQNPLKATKPGREWHVLVRDLIAFVGGKSYREGDRAGEAGARGSLG